MDDDSRPLVLVGDVQTRVPAPGDHRFLVGLWRRVREELRRAGPVARYVGLRAPRHADLQTTFLGVEVDDPAATPDGMFAWVFEGARFRVLQARDGQLDTLWDTRASWRWLHQPPPDAPTSSCTLGELRAALPPSWSAGVAPTETELALWHHAHVDLTRDGVDDEIELVEPRATWGEDYARMAAWLRAQLGERRACTIEHVGSTAIGGIPAKPIIDIVIETPDLSATKAILCPALSSALWECWANDDGSTLSYVKRERLGGRRTHHVHVQARGAGREPRALFRDFLRAHPEDAARYATLKRAILRDLQRHVGERATSGADRERYMRAKTEFVSEILQRARR